MFGESEIPQGDGFWLTALVGALVGALPVIGAWVLSALKERAALRRQDRADAIKEYQEWADRLERKLDEQEKELRTIRAELSNCEKRSAELEGELKLLNSQVRRLQAAAGDREPPTVLPVVVTASSDGIIRSVMGGVAPLLHWLPQELIRKSIEVLIPDRLKEEHRTAMQKHKETIEAGQDVDSTKLVVTHALTKEGIEIPVLISASSWKTDKGDWYFNAEIRQRFPDGDSGIRSMKGIK